MIMILIFTYLFISWLLLVTCSWHWTNVNLTVVPATFCCIVSHPPHLSSTEDMGRSWTSTPSQDWLAVLIKTGKSSSVGCLYPRFQEPEMIPMVIKDKTEVLLLPCAVVLTPAVWPWVVSVACRSTPTHGHWLTGDPDGWSLLTDPDPRSLVDWRPRPVVTAYWPRSQIIGWPLCHCLLTPIPDHWLTPLSLLTDPNPRSLAGPFVTAYWPRSLANPLVIAYWPWFIGWC